METNEFINYFKRVPHLKKHFKGVYAIDQIPYNIKCKSFVVVNLDPSYKAGSHWIALVKLIKDEIEIFDSLGVNLEKLLPFFKFNTKQSFIYNETPVQDTSSRLCGKFVIMFVIERMLNQGMTYEDLIEEIFYENKQFNDTIVNKFCESL